MIKIRLNAFKKSVVCPSCLNLSVVLRTRAGDVSGISQSAECSVVRWVRDVEQSGMGGRVASDVNISGYHVARFNNTRPACTVTAYNIRSMGSHAVVLFLIEACVPIYPGRYL